MAREGEHGAECVQWLVHSSPSAMRRSRHGSRTEAGSQERWRSWSETISKMFGPGIALLAQWSGDGPATGATLGSSVTSRAHRWPSKKR